MTADTSHRRGRARAEPSWNDGFLDVLYPELHDMATRLLARERVVELQPNALVDEAWLRLGADRQPRWSGRGHFFAAAAAAMRRILVDRARWRQAERHGGRWEHVPLDRAEVSALSQVEDDRLLAVQEVVERLAAQSPTSATLVRLRYFSGLSMHDVARALGVSKSTVWRWWRATRRWLTVELREAGFRVNVNGAIRAAQRTPRLVRAKKRIHRNR